MRYVVSYVILSDMSEPRFSAAGFRFSAFGFPVTVNWFHFALPAFWLSSIRFDRLAEGVSAAGIVAAYVGAVFLGVLGHELGHAFAARSIGASAEISLVLFGGLTSWSTGREITAKQRLRVSLAGPFAGMAVGAAAWVINNYVNVGRVELALFFELLTFVAFVWGVLNLIPFPGFDGGHSLDAALQIWVPDRAARWGAIIKGVASILGIGFIALRFGMLSAVIIGLFVFRGGANPFEEFRKSKDGDREAKLDQAVEALLTGHIERSFTLVKEAEDGAQSNGVRRRARELSIPILFWTERWDDLIAQDPSTVQPTTRGLALMRSGRLAEAEAVLRTAAQGDRRDALLAETLARQDIKLSSDADLSAIPSGSLVRLAVSMAGSDRDVAVRLANSALERGNLAVADEALALVVVRRFDEALLFVEGTEPGVRWEIDSLVAAEGQTNLQELLENPPNPNSMASLQTTLHEFGHFTEAARVGQMLTVNNSGSANTRLMLARSAMRSGDPDLAVSALSMAVANGLDPQLAVASQDLAPLRGTVAFAGALAVSGPIASDQS